jgi:hypothetical protein
MHRNGMRAGVRKRIGAWRVPQGVVVSEGAVGLRRFRSPPLARGAGRSDRRPAARERGRSGAPPDRGGGSIRGARKGVGRNTARAAVPAGRRGRLPRRGRASRVQSWPVCWPRLYRGTVTGARGRARFSTIFPGAPLAHLPLLLLHRGRAFRDPCRAGRFGPGRGRSRPSHLAKPGGAAYNSRRTTLHSCSCRKKPSVGLISLLISPPEGY